MRWLVNAVFVICVLAGQQVSAQEGAGTTCALLTSELDTIAEAFAKAVAELDAKTTELRAAQDRQADIARQIKELAEPAQEGGAQPDLVLQILTTGAVLDLVEEQVSNSLRIQSLTAEANAMAANAVRLQNLAIRIGAVTDHVCSSRLRDETIDRPETRPARPGAPTDQPGNAAPPGGYGAGMAPDRDGSSYNLAPLATYWGSSNDGPFRFEGNYGGGTLTWLDDGSVYAQFTCAGEGVSAKGVPGVACEGTWTSRLFKTTYQWRGVMYNRRHTDAPDTLYVEGLYTSGSHTFGNNFAPLRAAELEQLGLTE